MWQASNPSAAPLVLLLLEERRPALAAERPLCCIRLACGCLKTTGPAGEGLSQHHPSHVSCAVQQPWLGLGKCWGLRNALLSAALLLALPLGLTLTWRVHNLAQVYMLPETPQRRWRGSLQRDHLAALPEPSLSPAAALFALRVRRVSQRRGPHGPFDIRNKQKPGAAGLAACSAAQRVGAQAGGHAQACTVQVQQRVQQARRAHGPQLQGRQLLRCHCRACMHQLRAQSRPMQMYSKAATSRCVLCRCLCHAGVHSTASEGC